MDKEKKEQGRKCFIITPIGEENSDTFRSAKGVIESVIKPVLREYGFDDIKPAYEINVSGMINTQIINRIIEDDLVISNLTGNNPNVMYELCLRHVVAKPIIHICQNGTSLPFDIKDNRTIFYRDDMLGVEELKDSIIKFMDGMVYDVECMDNPIYNAYRYAKLLKDTQGTETNEILKLLVDMSSKLSEMKAGSDDKNIYRLNSSYSTLNGTIEMVYTFEQFINDRKNIDRDKVQELMKSKNKYRMRIYELAKELETSSVFLIRVARMLEMDIKSATASITPEEQNKILEFIKYSKNE